VGKTALTARFTWDYFIEDYNPNIDGGFSSDHSSRCFPPRISDPLVWHCMEEARKLAVIDCEVTMIDILDMVGQEEYR
jgi:hypothetical protein